MPTCIAKGCTNRSSMKTHRQEVLEETTKITFHVLPKNGARRQLWLTSLELDESSLPKQAVVCSVHFKSKDFDRTSLSCTRLKSHAIPYVQVPEDAGETNSDEYTEASNEEGLSSCLRLALKQEINDKLDVFAEPMECPLENRSLDSISFNERLEKVSRIVPPSKSECLQTLLQTKHKSVQVRMSCVDKSTSVSPERLFHSPEKEELRMQVARMKRRHQNELKLLKQKIRRSNKKIANLKTILQLLEKKNLSEDEHVETLKDTFPASNNCKTDVFHV